MSDTPETDKQWAEFINKLEKPIDVFVDFARKLERERDEALETLREIVAADWKTSGELQGMARQALEASK